MYAFIEGIVEDKTQSELVISTGGVGYRILCTAAVLTSAPQRGGTMRVYTFLNVRDDAMELFGFVSREEKNLFLKLNTISGIGPRTALGILGSMPLKDLLLAIIAGDIATLSRAPGVGKKTAQRLALELKDKFTPDDVGESMESLMPVQAAQQDSASHEAVLALLSLGYTQSEAVRAVSAVRAEAGEDARADELVRLVLRGMMKG